MMGLSYKQKGTDTRHEPLNYYTMNDDTVIAIYQGFRGENPDLDFIVKYKEPGKRLRTPSHTHWIVDLLVKADYNKKSVKEFINDMIGFYNVVTPFENVEQRVGYTLSTYRNFGQRHNQVLNRHGYYPMDTLCSFLELFSINEKQATGAFMFKTLLELVSDYCDEKKDFYQVVGYSKRV